MQWFSFWDFVWEVGFFFVDWSNCFGMIKIGMIKKESDSNDNEQTIALRRHHQKVPNYYYSIIIYSIPPAAISIKIPHR